MCKISKTTVIRANNRMIEQKRPIIIDDSFSHKENFTISVFANGKNYQQVVNQKLIHDAFKQAIIKTSTNHAEKLQFHL